MAADLGTRAVVLATGTFLRAKVVIGDRSYPAGRVGELPATLLSDSLVGHGIELGRFQSATPPRIDGRTIDATRMVIQPGEEGGLGFSHWERPRPRTQVPCYLTYTTARTHEVVADHLHLSPLKSGSVSGRGPRYCPSIDRKIINFPDRDRHPVFVEPEGARTCEMYLQGLTTSLPVFVQERIIQATPGLEHARLVRPGYAVEYDYLVPQQLTLSLEAQDGPRSVLGWTVERHFRIRGGGRPGHYGRHQRRPLRDRRRAGGSSSGSGVHRRAHRRSGDQGSGRAVPHVHLTGRVSSSAPARQRCGASCCRWSRAGLGVDVAACRSGGEGEAGGGGCRTSWVGCRCGRGGRATRCSRPWARRR